MTQNAAKTDSVRPADKEKYILNRYTELCIRKKDRGRDLRLRIERRMFADKYPEIKDSDVLVEDEKTMEDMLKQYMLLSEELTKLQIKLSKFFVKRSDKGYDLCDKVVYLDIYSHDNNSLLEENKKLKEELKALAEKYNVG